MNILAEENDLVFGDTNNPEEDKTSENNEYEETEEEDEEEEEEEEEKSSSEIAQKINLMHLCKGFGIKSKLAHQLTN